MKSARSEEREVTTDDARGVTWSDDDDREPARVVL